MDANNSQNSAENKSLDELDISSFSATGMDEKDEEIQKLKAKLEQLKEANSNQVGGPSMMQMGWQFGEKFGKMAKEMDGLKEKMDIMKEEFAGKTAKMEKKMKEIEAKNAELDEQIVQKNGEMGKMKAEFDQKIVEFEGMMRKSLEKKADKEMPVQFKNNKWNVADCGPKFFISEDGIVVTNSGSNGVNSIRAILPIPFFNVNSTNPSIACYYEVQIINEKDGLRWFSGVIQIGFCTRQFPLEDKLLVEGKNSIGIRSKSGMYIDGQYNKFGKNDGEYFKVGDVVGLGIIHFPANSRMKCFATFNGQLLGTVELPANFASLQLYPAATLYYANDSIRANFGQEPWRFNPEQLLK